MSGLKSSSITVNANRQPRYWPKPTELRLLKLRTWQWMRFWTRQRQNVAFVLMGLGGLLYLARPQPPETTAWIPIGEPIRLRVGSFTAPPFRAGRDTTYYISIESQSVIGLHRLECLLGIADRQQRDTSCPDAPEVIDIAWSVSQNGHLAAQGSSQSTRAGYYTGDTVAREIGRFQVKRGKTYSLTIDVHRNAQELDSTNPKLQVGIPLSQRAGEALARALYELANLLRVVASALLTAAGVLTLILPGLFRWLWIRIRASLRGT